MRLDVSLCYPDSLSEMLLVALAASAAAPGSVRLSPVSAGHWQAPHLTPFGYRAGGCTLEVPSGSRVDEAFRGDVGGVLVTRPRLAADGSILQGEWESEAEALFYPAPDHCHADMAALLERRLGKRSRDVPPYGRPSRTWNADNGTCTELPCDGWIDNAGWEINGEGHAFPKTVGQFNATCKSCCAGSACVISVYNSIICCAPDRYPPQHPRAARGANQLYIQLLQI